MALSSVSIFGVPDFCDVRRRFLRFLKVALDKDM